MLNVLNEQTWVLCRFKWRFSPPRVLVADLSKCSALGPSEGDWRSFPSEAAAEEWCEALDSAQAGELN